MSLHAERAIEGVWSPGTGVTSNCEQPCRFWESNPGSLEEDSVLLTTKLSPHPSNENLHMFDVSLRPDPITPYWKKQWLFTLCFALGGSVLKATSGCIWRTEDDSEPSGHRKNTISSVWHLTWSRLINDLFLKVERDHKSTSVYYNPIRKSRPEDL